MRISNFTKKYERHIAIFFLLNLLIEIVSPTAALALTSGPNQPEVQEFQAINVSDMVDPSTGDGSYNLPLLEIDGYPVNLSYRSGVAMDQEATYVGLGWNMNVGSISRNLRGIPDDFDGDMITKKMNMKDNESYGVSIGIGGELFGIDALNTNGSLGLTYNNYSGYDFVKKIGFSLSLGSHASVGLGLTSSADGLTIAPNLSFSAKLASADDQVLRGSASLGTSFNSRTGMKEIGLNVGMSASFNNKQEKSTKPWRSGNKPGKNNHSSSNNLGSVGNGSSISFGSPTYIPQITMPMHTNAIVGSFKVGGTLFGVDVTANIGGNYSKQSLETKQITAPSYGYLNIHKGQNSDNAMLDFNREKDGNFTEATTNLPIPNLTYDNFSVMGQGVGGSYRPFRSDVGFVYDPRAGNTSESNSIGVELSLGNAVQAGIDFVSTTVDGSSGKWSDQNYAISAFQFKGSGYKGYEPAYFKEMGEMNVDDDPLYTNMTEEAAARFLLDDIGQFVGIQKQLINENSVVFDLTNKNTRTKRVKRNQLFSYLTVKEYQNFGLQTSLFGQIAKLNGSTLTNGHHIGQITTTKTDGSRYVYGLPVYNNQQKEVSFNVSGFLDAQYEQNTNMVQYIPGVDDTENNGKGIDNFFTSTETPPFAYGYMLTAVLSPDYVDKTGDGPTPDDVGNYTLFKYGQKISDYKWRTPHSYNGAANYANLDEGLLSNNQDNKASYVYGKKDIYYLTSIEGKNHIALLEYSNRQDGLGVINEAGGNNGATPQKQLDLVTLYSFEDYKIKQANPSYNPFIIKQVHFNYNYELCPGIYNHLTPSNTNGKLTLKQVYFTYGNSAKGVLSPYKFNYNLDAAGLTVKYNPANIDRWGNYKPNPIVPSKPPQPAPNSPPAPPSNSKFPYVEQNKSLEDQYVALWNLKSIQLPSGGLMEIIYESDDYAYIQNRRAGEMFKAAGFSPDNNPANMNNQLFNGSTANSILFFKLKNQLSLPSSQANFVSDYLDGIDKMYFRFYTKINCGSNSDIPKLTDFGASASYIGYEFVQGYAQIDPSVSGYVNFNSINYGYVKVNTVRQSKGNSTQENPVSKAAWQMARMQTPKDAYSCSSSYPTGDVEAVLKAMADASFIKNTIQFFQGYNGALKALGYGQNFEPALSWVRLNNPDYKKLGGGSRVKKVTIQDQWNKMLTNNFGNTQGFQYGQQYDYTTTENGRVISSGVASYEPTFGADENPFRQPVFMEDHKAEALLAPNNNMYVEEPMGEAFFPSPSVVYSKVTVKNLVAGAGATVNEYYTARDFPTQVHSLGMDAKRKKPNPIFSLFSFNSYDRFTGSQGYSIELNDMHGKPKAVHTYEEGSSVALTSTKYIYKQNGNKLVNTVKTVAKDGTIKDTRIGVDYDFYADFRENNTTTEAVGVTGNLYFMIAGLFPITVGPILPTYHREEIQLRTAVTNKVIYKYGIIERVETTDGTNVNATDNLLWDSETGQVLLTGTTTEFKDPIYSTAYPGHWAYEGLAGSYKNTNLEIINPSTYVNVGGQINDAFYLSALYPGDEIALTSATANDKGYVDKIGTSYYFTLNGNSGGNLTSTPLNQAALAAYTNIKVIRSGRHNLQDQKVGAVTSFVNPLYNNPSVWPLLNQSYGITNATSVEMGGVWQGYCGCNFVSNGSSASTAYPNQYVFGVKGNFRKIKDYTYLTLRKQTKQNGNTNIRVDGTFENFSPFWTPNAGNNWVANPTNWQWVSEATKYSPYGFDLENKDALNRYSGAQYGYQQTLPVAVSSNSKYKQAANESFEYNVLNFCEDDHLSYNQHRANTYVTPPPGNYVLLQKYAHTGKRSIKVAPTQIITINKQINQCQ